MLILLWNFYSNSYSAFLSKSTPLKCFPFSSAYSSPVVKDSVSPEVKMSGVHLAMTLCQDTGSGSGSPVPQLGLRCFCKLLRLHGEASWEST